MSGARVTSGDATAPAGRSAARPPGSLIVVAAGLAILVLIAVVALVRPSATVERYPIDTPEGTLQAYLEARESADPEVSWAYLSERAKHSTPLGAYSDELGWQAGVDRLVVVDGVEVTGDRARVRVTVTSYSEPGLLDRGTWSSEQVVRLVREDGQWRIEDPWFIY